MKHRIESAIVLVGVLLLSAASARAQSTRSVRVGVGHTAIVTFKRAFINVRVPNPRIANVLTTTSRSITIVGVNPGDTDLVVNMPGGRFVRIRVMVTKVQIGALFRAVRRFLGAMEGVQPYLFGEWIIIEGKALTAKDYGRVVRATQLFGRKVKNYAGYTQSAVDDINKVLTAAGLTTVRATLISNMAFLEGAVGSKTEMAKVNKLIKTMNLKVNNLVSIGKGRQVLVEVKFVELQRSNNINFGLQLPAAITFSAGVEGQVPIYPSGGSQVTLNLKSPEDSNTVSLNLLFQSGKARMLAKPKLVCGSGEKAKFMVGGEVPIVVQTSNTFAVEYKPFGILLDIQPVADSRGNITAKLKAEVSEPDWSHAVSGFPAFITRKVETKVTMKEGSTLILSGLYTHKMSKAINKIPLLGHIPILGELFRSHQYQREKTNLVIFVTTRTITASHPWAIKQHKIGERRSWRFKRETEWEIFE